MSRFSTLSLRDKLTFLSMFKDAASDGPLAAAKFLQEIDVFVCESDVRFSLIDLGWSESYFHSLWEACPTHYVL